MTLTVAQYFGKWMDVIAPNSIHHSNAIALVTAVNKLIAYAESCGVTFKINPITGSIVSGESFGGFRPQSCPIGAPASAHKQALAVDLYDPDNKIDDWLKTVPLKTLETYGLYFEHPTATNRWSHWGTRAPKSGRRFFYP